jgi:hypothetical protein
VHAAALDGANSSDMLDDEPDKNNYSALLVSSFLQQINWPAVVMLVQAGARARGHLQRCSDLWAAFVALSLRIISRLGSCGLPGPLVQPLVALPGVEVCAHPSMCLLQLGSVH